jgi:hypothetical protein
MIRSILIKLHITDQLFSTMAPKTTLFLLSTLPCRMLSQFANKNLFYIEIALPGSMTLQENRFSALRRS